MSRNTKIVVIVVVILLLLCCCMGVGGLMAMRAGGSLLSQVVSQGGMSVTEKPEEVAQIARNMVDYNLPPDYQAQFGMSFFGFNMAAFGPADESTMIMVMQFPAGLELDQVEMERQMQQALQRQMGQQELKLAVVDQISTIIRDQEVSLTVQEGTAGDGRPVRQMSGVFQGKQGLVMLMVIGSPENWNQQAIDAFITSLQ
jgi:hypothetical protein